ncbi:MAG: hypothetical protein HZA88_14290 [Verrucomicrobia bacterium]|nr:hypothetical protein [Verrucomicrobiota bacterium]
MSLCSRWLTTLLTASAFAVTGCSTLTPVAQAPLDLHVVAVNHAGKPLRANPRETDGEWKPMPSRDFDALLARLVESIAASRCTNLVVFIPGGLNSIESGVEMAARLTPDIMATGSYPLFIAWDSRLTSTYWEHLTLIRRGQEKPIQGKLSAPVYAACDVGGSLLRAPVVWFHQGAIDLKNSRLDGTSYRTNAPATETASDKLDNLINTEIADVNALYWELRRRYNSDPAHSIAVSLGGFDRTTCWQLTRYGLSWLTLPTKLVCGPAIDGLGTSAWENMRRRTSTLFRAPEEFYLEDRWRNTNEVTRVLDNGSCGGMAQFLEAIRSLEKLRPLPITLVAHSAGTLVANEMIRRCPELPFRNIVYLAAACSIRDWDVAVVPYLAAHPESRFYNLSLHPSNEVGEANAGDLAPRGSLLAWIDEFLAHPETVQDRTLGRWENIIQATHLIPRGARPQVTLKAFSAGDATRYGPQEHSDFSETAFWNPVLWQADAPWKAEFWQRTRLAD